MESWGLNAGEPGKNRLVFVQSGLLGEPSDRKGWFGVFEAEGRTGMIGEMHLGFGHFEVERCDMTDRYERAKGWSEGMDSGIARGTDFACVQVGGT